MILKNTCLVCGNDDNDKINFKHDGEVCEVCGNGIVSNTIIHEKPENQEASYNKLF